MSKFENSIYKKLWDSQDGKLISMQILQNPDLIHSNHTFWKQKFRVGSQILQADPKGKTSFKAEMRQIEKFGMMDLRAPLGDSQTAEYGNAAFYTGVVPDFISKGYVETAMEREYKEELFDQFGDAELIRAFANDFLQPALDSANQTLSNMAAQIMSKGYITYNFGDGIKAPLLKADIPTENFLKAGTKAWTASDCKLLDQVRKIYKDVQEHLGMTIPMQLEITRNMWINVWLKNAQVLELIRYYASLNNVLFPEVFEADTDMAMTAIEKSPLSHDLPKIVIVEESQNNNGTTVHGWNDNTAVLRPLGYAGEVIRTNILDEKIYKKYGSSAIIRNFAPALNGVALLMNTTINNGNLKEWHSDLMMSAIPALDEFLYHFIIDTTQTSVNTF